MPYATCMEPGCPELVEIESCWCREHTTHCPDATCHHGAHLCEDPVHFCDQHQGENK